MASSRRPHGVLVASKAFLRSSHCVLRSSMWRSMELARRFHCVCAALLAFAPRFHGVRTALPRRSSTALTACRQNSLTYLYVCFQEDSMTGKRGRRKAVTKGKSPKKTDDVPPPTLSPQVEISPALSPQKQRDESRGRAVRS